MKYIVLSAIAALTLIGCGSTNSNGKTVTQSTPKKKHIAVTSASVGGTSATVVSNGSKTTTSATTSVSSSYRKTTTVPSDKPITVIPDPGYSDKPSNTTPPSKPSHGHGVIVSQDITDEDNFSIIRAAINMDKAGYIKLLAVTVTGKDTNNRGGLLFSIAGSDKTPTILINKNPSLNTRVTNASGIYSNLNNYPSDDLLDSQRDDSSLYLESIIENHVGKVTYIVGGHLHNFADLLKRNPTLVNSKIDKLVIDTGWNSRTSGNPEMNLSQGTTNITGTSQATAYVFKNFKGKILISSDPYAKWTNLDISILGPSTGLYYLVKNGRYYKNSKVFNMADFPALFYGGIGTKYNGKTIGREVQTCYDLTPWSAIIAKAGKCNRYYIENSNNREIESFFKQMMK